MSSALKLEWYSQKHKTCEEGVVKTMKKIAILLAASVCLPLLGQPGPHRIHNRPHSPMYGPRIHHATPPPPRHHHHHHHSGPFWTGVGIGLAGGLLSTMIAPPPAPVVIQATPQRVWIPPVYGERPVYRAGIYVGTERYIITPGYWTTTY